MQALESKAEFIIEDGKIIEIKINDVKGKKPLSKKELKEFKNYSKNSTLIMARSNKLLSGNLLALFNRYTRKAQL